MANYLKDDNQLIVWPVLKEAAESNMLLGNIGVRARYDMTNKELLEICLSAWKVNEDKNYRLFLIRGDGKVEVSLDGDLKEAGIRNGDFLEIA
ncbi:hypothetical protein [Bacillus benzoevorans]|uniref:Uncharacterized protein n=1 Tax=Bacillus benzoevorans TaxID=1456 RepID=A0A7X0HQI2_9BACI|nr:hypothetical protein [Bacillus benzoevorans]MBB6444939.1 hypothetical protein [Bacillus benzoevorans]